MFILLFLLLIDHIHTLEWNCTKSSYISLVVNEQCTIIVEYLSIDQQWEICMTDRLLIQTLPPPSYSSNYSMKNFRINFCQLMTLSQLPFTLPSSIEILDLSSNLLTNFIFSYPLPSSIKYLYLNNNPNLIEIHFSQKHIQNNLISLSLQHNHRIQLSSLPESLIQLDLTDCHLSQTTMILTLLKSLKNLTHLSLAENQLEQLPILEERMNLKYLNLSNNYLKIFNEYWLNENLQILDLRFNQIKSLEFLTNRSQSIILQLYLYGNSFSCDCYYSSILNSHFINLIDSSSLFCSSSFDIHCNYSQHCSNGCTCCDFEACDCHSICPWDCSCSHDALWINHRIDCKERNISIMHILLPESMTDLNYENNQIEEINPLVFIGKIHLKKLNLARNNLRNLTNQTFCSAMNLNEINFSINPQLMNILPNINQLFACLKSLQYIYLSREQIQGEMISQEWMIDKISNDLFRLKRIKTIETTTILSIIHQEFYTTTNLIKHHQALILLLFFLLIFLLLFSLLLISLAICRRKLHELQLQQTQTCPSNCLSSSITLKIPESHPVNESLYEQLPSLSSDSEQPFLYQDKPSTNPSPPPALPPYPPILVLGNCSNQPTISCQCFDAHILYREKNQ